MLLAGCAASRHVAPGNYLLDKVKLSIDDSTGTFRESEMINYVRQMPNHKVLWGTKLQLGIYNMSGRDSTKWYNRLSRKLGQPPVVYDEALTEAGARQLRTAMINKGFLGATVEVDTTINERKRKIQVGYKLTAGRPHQIRSIDYVFANDTLRDIIMYDSAQFILRPGQLLDRGMLDMERDLIAGRLRNEGYYAFTKELISFSADTTEGSYDVDLTVIVNPPQEQRPGAQTLPTHESYRLRRVVYVTDYDPTTMYNLDSIPRTNEETYRNLDIIYGEKRYLRPNVLWESCFLVPGMVYNAQAVQRTYNALTRLSILKFINIRFVPVANVDGQEWLDAFILLTPARSQTATLELEGTNSEGDFGVAAAISYSHRNLGRGSETLTTRFRGAYEAIGGNSAGFIHSHYMEYSADIGLSFPKFKFPFLKESFKRKINATSDLNVAATYQQRPEYTRIIANAGWSYKWTERPNGNRHIFTPLDINYVYLPENTNDFIDQIAPDNPLLRYSYEDHFIMRMAYSFYRTNKRREQAWSRSMQRNIFTLRVNAETAGNFLFALNSIFSHRDNFREDPYKVFGIRYSQYVKAEADYSLLHIFNHRTSVAFHAGFGIGVPYGNSTILPFEKRFYGGGANGVRGWAVRTLGPGSYAGSNRVIDFINQCGDIRIDLSAEYRAKLFWVVELGAFIDIGNIWTIHSYESQPGGMFHFNKFYKQLAASYGLGLRLDFNYFLLRLDLGMKAHDPAAGREPWPLIHPNWKRDRALHFSIGYPF